MRIPVLFCTPNSTYNYIAIADPYDKKRDALTWKGGNAAIYHPPCRLWGKLAHMAKADNPDYEKHLGLWSIEMVEKYGGVIEHPEGTKLFDHVTKGMGFITKVNQCWFGHPFKKATMLYIVGIEPDQLPWINKELIHQTTLELGPESWREKTPLLFAYWLLQIPVLILNS